jgi:hypothetical protein
MHLGGCAFHDDISIEVVVQDCFICSIRCCVLLSISEYHISGAVKHLGQWIVYEVLLSGYAVPNEYSGCGSEIQLVLFLFLNIHKGQALEHMEMLQQWPLCRIHARPHTESYQPRSMAEC